MPVSQALFIQLLRKQKEQTITAQEMILLQFYLSTPEGISMLEATDFSDLPAAVDEPGSSAGVRYLQIRQITEKAARVRLLRRRWIASVAAILIGIAGTALLYRYLPQRVSPTAVAMQTLRTGNGEIKEIILPDSSHVWLDARSVLSYPQTFSGSVRKIILQQGQAFFEVSHNAAKPFIVESSNGIQTRVLGTSFSVRSSDNAAGVQVAVKTGKVKMEEEGNTIATLLPGDQVYYNTIRSVIRKTRVAPDNINVWTKGEIKLQQADFTEMATTMQQLYGLTIVADNPAINRNRYSLTIRYHSDPEKLLEVISRINSNHFRRKASDSTFVTIY